MVKFQTPGLGTIFEQWSYLKGLTTDHAENSFNIECFWVLLLWLFRRERIVRFPHDTSINGLRGKRKLNGNDSLKLSSLLFLLLITTACKWIWQVFVTMSMRMWCFQDTGSLWWIPEPQTSQELYEHFGLSKHLCTTLKNNIHPMRWIHEKFRVNFISTVILTYIKTLSFAVPMYPLIVSRNSITLLRFLRVSSFLYVLYHNLTACFGLLQASKIKYWYLVSLSLVS